MSAGFESGDFDDKSERCVYVIDALDREQRDATFRSVSEHRRTETRDIRIELL